MTFENLIPSSLSSRRPNRFPECDSVFFFAPSREIYRVLHEHDNRPSNSVNLSPYIFSILHRPARDRSMPRSIVAGNRISESLSRERKMSMLSCRRFRLPVFQVGWIGLGATFEPELGAFDDAIDLGQGHLGRVAHLKNKTTVNRRSRHAGYRATVHPILLCSSSPPRSPSRPPPPQDVPRA